VGQENRVRGFLKPSSLVSLPPTDWVSDSLATAYAHSTTVGASCGPGYYDNDILAMFRRQESGDSVSKHGRLRFGKLRHHYSNLPSVFL